MHKSVPFSLELNLNSEILNLYKAMISNYCCRVNNNLKNVQILLINLAVKLLL